MAAENGHRRSDYRHCHDRAWHGFGFSGVRTTAIKDGDEFVINGSKTFITNGQLADLYIVVCKTDTGAGAKGVTLFLVEADRKGFAKGKI